MTTCILKSEFGAVVKTVDLEQTSQVVIMEGEAYQLYDIEKGIAKYRKVSSQVIK